MNNCTEQRTTTTLELTQDELDIILTRRAEIEKERKTRDFHRRIIKIAHDWVEWSEKEKRGLTFSSFVNEFGFNEIGADIYYDAILGILDCVRAFEPLDE